MAQEECEWDGMKKAYEMVEDARIVWQATWAGQPKKMQMRAIMDQRRRIGDTRYGLEARISASLFTPWRQDAIR